MTDGPLKRNSTMCCRGRPWRGRDGGERGGPPPPPSPLSAFGLAPCQSGSRGRRAPLAFRLLRLFFPPPCPRVGGEKLEALSSPPLRHTETCLGSTKQQLYHLLWIYTVHSFRAFLSNLQPPPWIYLPCGFLHFSAFLWSQTELCSSVGSNLV